MNFDGGNASNYDINQDFAKSPLWRYIGKNQSVFKCPSDRSTVTVGTKIFPRLRSISMSQVFSPKGPWLTGTFNNSAPNIWQTCLKSSSIRKPSETWVFIDEHPDGINEVGFANACTGAITPGTPKLIDWPANYHNGAGGLSFADGHAVIHKWKGPKIRKEPITYTYRLTSGGTPLSDPQDIEDVRWLAQNTTVLR
jgi:prepilin-type processing-associated H-X9-DG protein